MNTVKCTLVPTLVTDLTGTRHTRDVPVINLKVRKVSRPIPCAYFLPVMRLPLETRIKRMLLSYNLTYTGQLACSRADEISIACTFGDKSLNKVKEAMAPYFLSFISDETKRTYPSRWFTGKEELFCNQFFPPYLSLQTAWKLLFESVYPDPLTMIDKRLLIPLELLSIPPVVINTGKKILSSLQERYHYRRDYSTLYLGDIIAAQTNIASNRNNFNAVRWRAEIHKLADKFQLNDCNCGYDWFQPGFEKLSRQYFPDPDSVKAVLNV